MIDLNRTSKTTRVTPLYGGAIGVFHVEGPVIQYQNQSTNDDPKW